MRYILIVLIAVLFSCKGGTPAVDLSALDLMKHGMPIKIKAPADAVVVADDLGIMKDVTVKGDDNYYIQILSGLATTTDVSSIKAEQIAEVKNGPFFDEILLDEPNGFIFRKKISEDRINHDFRYIKIQGDMEYTFQTGLMGQFSEADAKAMYESVK